jgi:hypothetical protein
MKALKMKTRQNIVLISLTLFMTSITGCTTQAWYEGAKRGAENNCRNQPPSETDRCLEKLNKKTYEEYEKERAGQK